MNFAVTPDLRLHVPLASACRRLDRQVTRDHDSPERDWLHAMRFYSLHRARNEEMRV